MILIFFGFKLPTSVHDNFSFASKIHVEKKLLWNTRNIISVRVPRTSGTITCCHYITTIKLLLLLFPNNTTGLYFCSNKKEKKRIFLEQLALFLQIEINILSETKESIHLSIHHDYLSALCFCYLIWLRDLSMSRCVIYVGSH